jgi:hypothetical protein
VARRSRAWKARPDNPSTDRPLLSVRDRQMPTLGARGGHGRRGRPWLRRGSNGHKLNRRVRLVHHDHLHRWQGPSARGSRRVGFEPAVGLPSAGRRCEGASTCRRAGQPLVSSFRRRAALSRHWVEAASPSTDRVTASLLAHRSGIVLQ